MKELIAIQGQLKAPKNQYNSFGKYHYRSAEDILEAVKPLLNQVGATLTLSDEIVSVGNRIYVKATATIRNSAGEEQSTTAFAREPEDKKGMDASQITGTASSYARKYAMNGLFCIDDNKDADTDEYQGGKPKAKSEPAPAPKKLFIDENQRIELENTLMLKGVSTATILNCYKLDRIEDMTTAQYDNCLKRLSNTPDRKEV